MSIFQSTVVAKHLKGQNSEIITAKWNIYKDHFLNPAIQENIRNSKEEQYQGGFIIDLFVNVLGYIKNPTPHFNITTEYKNIKDSKKADGAIIINEVVKAVIELKGTNTTDLGKVESQAFGYKNNQPQCTYIITSNFEKLRFYIDNAIEHIEFNLFTLTEEKFKLLYLCLAYENIEKDIPKKIKEESVSQEDAITKKLYKDYSLFRNEIFNNILKNNPDYDKLTLFKKSQKLLDRFLFLFFAEDRQLLPPNSVRLVLKQWKQLKNLDAYTPLYDRFKKYFGYLNTGFKGKQYDVYAYNGGLFKTDEILDAIVIDDNLLYKHTLNLSEYDFESEVSVNILGHIFEHSLTEIEDIQNEIQGFETDKGKSKRKKEGVYYTPKYITKYIVDNTVGKLCEEKKTELNIIEEDYEKERKGRKKAILKVLIEKLDGYHDWLLKLTICDPACGSGAFLNQALDFLITEHRYIDELRAKLHNVPMVIGNIENSILENNLFGVDINEEGIEIAKLSLWLHTAQKGRKLITLSNNIKCGNSLIDDPEIAGDKAFNWQEEFPQIFAKGGFDVVIGNPPYVNVELMPIKDKEYYRGEYQSFFKRSDLFSLFVDMATMKLTKDGIISFIIPSTILNNLSYKLIRARLLSNEWLSVVCYTGNKVFKDVTVDTTILVIDKSKKHKQINLVNAINFSEQKSQKVKLDYFKKYDNNISIGQDEENNLTDKIFNDNFIKADHFFQIFQGVVTGNNDAYIFETKEDALKKGIDGELLKPMCHGRDISKWYIDNKRVLCYLNGDIDIEEWQKTKTWLSNFKEKLLTRRECKNGTIPWYSLQWPREQLNFEKYPKILIQNTRNERLQPRIVATIDDRGLFGTQGLNFIISTSKYNIYSFLGLLNSKLINYLFSTKFLNLAIKADYLKKLKFPIQLNEYSIDKKAKLMSELNVNLNKVTNSFLELLIQKFSLDKISKKLQRWYLLEFNEFLKELKKKKIELTLSKEAEWMQYFNEQKEIALAIKSKIDTTDKEIDQMVYELYGLTEEEIEIVENS